MHHCFEVACFCRNIKGRQAKQQMREEIQQNKDKNASQLHWNTAQMH